MKKLQIPTLLLLLLSAVSIVKAQELTVSLKIQNIKPNKGNIVVRIYRSASSFDKRTPDSTIKLPASNAEIIAPLKLQAGNYLFSLYQDENENGQLDKYFFGMPKEPVGMSSNDGKEMSKDFEKSKIIVDHSQTIVVRMRGL